MSEQSEYRGNVYRYLDIMVEDGVAIIEVTNPAYTTRGHYEITSIWAELDEDPEVRSCLLAFADPPSREPLGAHRADWYSIDNREDDPALWFARWQQNVREAIEGVEGMLRMRKLVVSALRGPCGLGAALIAHTLADVSIASETASISDCHVERGTPCGDGAIFWAFMCGLQKAKYLALTGDEISGREAEQMGLVSLALPEDEVMDTARRYAQKFADGPQHSLAFTKRMFNGIIRGSGVQAFEHGLALTAMHIMIDPESGAGAGRVPQGYPRTIDKFEQPDWPSVKASAGPPPLT